MATHHRPDDHGSRSLCSFRAIALGGALLAAWAMVTACGDGISGQSVPQMRVTGQNLNSGGGLDLTRGDLQGEPAAVLIENYGDATLTVESLSVSDDAPDAISFAGAVNSEESCEFTRSNAETNAEGSACSDGQFCDDQLGNCRNATLPETPFEIEPDADRELEFLRLAVPEGESINCPDEAPDGAPQSVREDYCGSLRITSNSRVDNELVTDGNATVYFQASPGSGRIDVSGVDFSFQGVEPGESVNDLFTVSNVGQGPLTINGMGVEAGAGDANFTSNFEISTNGSPASYPIEIPAGTNNSQQFTLTFNAPSSAMAEQLNFQHYLVVNSSSIEALPDQPINVSSRVSTGPAARFSPTAFSFDDSNTRTLTISNEGTENLTLNSLSFSPEDASGSYTVLNDGTDVCASSTGGSCNFSSNRVVQAEGSKELTIEYSPGNFDERIVQLSINHGDPFADGFRTNETINSESTTVQLLGTQDGGLGRVRPVQLNFAQGGDMVRSKYVVLRNLGTSAFDTDEFAWRPDPDNPPPELYLNRGLSGNTPINEQNPVTLQPGSLTVARLNYDPSTAGGDPAQGISVEFDGTNNLGPAASSLTCGDAGTKLCPTITQVSEPRPSVEAIISSEAEGEPPQIEVRSTITLSGRNSTYSESGDLFFYWASLQRPADSHVFVNPREATGNESITIRPDRPGTYTIMMGALGGSISDQDTFTFEAVPRSN